MKRFDFWFLFRFLIITAVYSLESIFIAPFFLALDPRFFSFVLLLYLLAIIASFFFDEDIKLKIKLISDVVFLCIFCITTVLLLGFSLGDNGAMAIFMFLYSPMLILCLVWFIRDIKKMKKIKGENFFKAKDTSYSNLYVSFLFRVFLVSMLYYLLNRFFSYKLLLAQNIFWFIIAAYFLIFIISLFMKKISIMKLLVVLDVVFLCIFCLQSMCMIFNSYMEYLNVSTRTEPKWYEILTISPLVVCFAFWLVWDIKKLGKLKDVEAME